MTAVRVAGRIVLGAVLILICVAVAACTPFVPPAWTLAWIALVAAVVTCASLAWFALQPKGDGDG